MAKAPRLSKLKQPKGILLKVEGSFAFVGLWDKWTGQDEGELETFTIITVEPNEGGCADSCPDSVGS